MPSAIPPRVLVYGLGVAGAAAVTALASRGYFVLAGDDRLGEPGAPDWTALPADGLIGPAEIERALARVDGLVPTPGLPESHRVISEARRSGIDIFSEFDLAAEWDDRPFVSVTGTNGKTTVTAMIAEMMRRDGRRVAEVGNTETPMVAAIAEPDIDWFVVESSSFRLAWVHRFGPVASAWLNFAPDHLDVHSSVASYEAAKLRSWTELPDGSVAVANLDDPVVAGHVGEGDAQFVTYGSGPGISGIDHYRDNGDELSFPDGTTMIRTTDLWRSLPHDRSNALAAAAVAEVAGVDRASIVETLRSFAGMAHRVETVAVIAGVTYIDDSKATAPHATRAAVAGFGSVVLIAGGRNKGLDLAVLSECVPPVRAVVGIGESADDIAAVFAATHGELPVAIATSMADAVDVASSLAVSGDVVLLSPACASFDWYRNYSERGDDFSTEVRRLAAVAS